MVRLYEGLRKCSLNTNVLKENRCNRLSKCLNIKQTENVEDLSEPELYDLIVKYIRSDKLRAMEDEGMSQLLHLEDLLTDLLQNPDARASTTDDSVSHQIEKSLTQQPVDTSPTTLLDRQSTVTNTARDTVVHPPARTRSSFFTELWV